MPTKESDFWFTMQPRGRNFLATMVKTVCEKAGFKGKMNHRLCAMEDTWLLAANIPEKLIQECTVHCNTTSLHMYEHTSCQQQMSVSSIIAWAAQKKFGPLPCTGPEQNLSNVLRAKNQSCFDNCQNCTVNVNIQYDGPSTN